VKNTNNPLRLNIGYLYNKPIGTSREVPVDIDKIEIEDLLIRDLRSLVRISRTREGLLLQVEGDAQIETVCVKCLVEFFQPVGFDFEELYQFPSRHREETDLILPMDGYIDLRSLFREYLILAMPIRPVCSSNCKGLCAVCGANLNKKICEHHPELMTEKGVIEG
jgi:uncharacterized protein